MHRLVLARCACASLVFFTLSACAPAQDSPRIDLHGDPLPAGAVARAGSGRWRQPASFRGLVYSPDGKWLASAGGDAQVRLWEVATGRPRHVIPAAAGLDARRLAFSPDGRTLAVIGDTFSDDRTLHLWDVATGKHVRSLPA